MSSLVDYRNRIELFKSYNFNIQKQEHDFKQLSSRTSIGLGSGPTVASPVHSPTYTIQSQEGFNRLDPYAIEYELKDYKELFSKLKVTYLEQETKETFLRLILDEGDNDKDLNQELELWKISQVDIETVQDKNRNLKQALVEKKKRLQVISDEIAALVKSVCERYEKLNNEMLTAETMLQEMEDMEKEIAELEAVYPEKVEDVDQILSLKETLEICAATGIEQDKLRRDIENLRSTVIPDRKQQLQSLKHELSSLQDLQKKLEHNAQRAVTKRQAELVQGTVVQKENIGKWYANVLEIIAGILPVNSVTTGENSIDFTMSVSDPSRETHASQRKSYNVRIIFSSGVFKDAIVTPSTETLSESINILVSNTCESNNIRYFIEELRMLLEK
ncbi:hypothetical protein V1511DRAFT_497066 [Dipodascopsis uninucleata]